MNEGILRFWQDTTRERGYPPFPLEVALRFRMEVVQAQTEAKEVASHLLKITQTDELPKQNRPDVINAVLPTKQLPPGPGQIDLKRYTGRNGWPNLRDRMLYWYSEADVLYVHGSVDFILHDEQIALVPETEDFFYSTDSPRLPDYQPGTRPFLEQVVEETTQGCETDRAKAMALVRLIGNPQTSPYRHRDPNWNPFLGGREEEVLRKGWRMCNEISRALCFLCQVSGMPARTLFLFTDPLTGVPGHSITEIFFEGKWNHVEQNRGIMFLMEDGYFASTVELRDNPDIVNARADVGGSLGLANALYQGPISVVPYDIDRTNHYAYPWQ